LKLWIKLKYEVGMVGPKSTQTRFLGIITSTIYIPTLAFLAPVDVDSHNREAGTLLVLAILWVFPILYACGRNFNIANMGYTKSLDYHNIGQFIPAPPYTQKASVGMYSGRDYPQKSCLCTFWPYHPYFILQFYSIVFYTCYYSFFIALWAKPEICIFQ
jgi:hypothetical protein